MKLEARDPRNIDSVCVASVIGITGARLRLRLDGCDNKNDFWRLVDSSDIQPVGTCEQGGDLLQPPLGCRMGSSSWSMFLLRVLTGSELAPAVFFKKEPPRPPQNNFVVGMKIEAIDRKNPFMICPATIGAVYGDEIHINFDGWSGKFDYWCSYDSRDIFPVGWCRLTGDVLQPPGKIVPKRPRKKPTTRQWRLRNALLEIQKQPQEKKPSLVVYALNPTTQKAEAEAAEKPGCSVFTSTLGDEDRTLKDDQAAPAEKKPRDRGFTKPSEDEARPGGDVQVAPVIKKRKGKTVTTPWTGQPSLFADPGASPGEEICMGKIVTTPWTDQPRFFAVQGTAPAEKKRKGKTVTTLWTDRPRHFADPGATPAEKKHKGKRVTKHRKDQAQFLADEEAMPALFSALSVSSTETTLPSSSEQPNSSTSKGAQSSRKSPRKTSVVQPVPKTRKKSGQTKSTGDTSSTKKGITIKIVLPKKRGGKSGKKEKSIPVVSSTSSASLSSPRRSSSSNRTSVGPSEIVMSTICVYINKHGDSGPYLDPQKVQQLPDHFGPGPVNVILRQTVQACVDSAFQAKDCFLLLKPDTRGGEMITAFFDGKAHTVHLPPVNSASFALHFLENFCRSMQCDNFLSSQPFRRKAHTSTAGIDQSKPGNEEQRGTFKRLSLEPQPSASVSSKIPRKSGRASKVYLIIINHSSVDAYLDCFHFLTRVNRAEMDLDEQKAAEDRNVTGKSLHGGQERPLHEAVKVKPELYWRPQEVGDDRAVGYCQGELHTGSGTSSRDTCVAVKKAGRAEPSDPLDI
ncbi:LOW QUALITY PROTEIN: sex comb on midleg-like protein 2 [Arvicanthis niloticus]|uniref:LOW QUALITY PROTEIN: sex comb on midleg-like protein 2 n=1 Tax=Arvicanthis niloticus TaxID=61156 RepID=UPI00402BC021